MRSAIFLIAALAPLGVLLAQDEQPLTPEEALKKKPDEKIIVVMEVKSTGGNTARY